jgi:hypothetical protein
MVSYLSEGPAEGEEDGALFPNFLMADSQISDLDLSSPELESQRPPLPSTFAPSNPRHESASARAGRESRYGRELATRTTPSRHKSRNHAPANIVSRGSKESWDSDIDVIDERQIPRQPDESQQDLAERINNLTRAINENATFCLEISGRMVELARENKHLLDVSKSTLETYVLQPALRMPGILKTYYPGICEGLHGGLQVLKEYESQLRRTVQNCANGRDLVRAQGVAGGEGSRRGEMTRLKDRLVEQDVLLRDSSQHVQRLIREREALKKQLDARRRDAPQLHEVDLMGLGISGATADSQQNGGLADGDEYDGRLSSESDFAVLADHLREMRVLMDRLALHEVSHYNPPWLVHPTRTELTQGA